MFKEPRAYSRIAWVAVALAGAVAACSSAEPIHGPFVDGAALGQGGAKGIQTTDETTDQDAGSPPEAGPDGGAPDELGAEAGATVEDGGGSVAAASADAATSDGKGADAASGPVTVEAESGGLFGRATTVACAACSGGQRVSLPADSGVTLSNVVAPQAGTDTLLIYYTNGDSKSRSIYIGVNGADSQMLLAVFPSTGDAGKVSSIAVPLSGFNAGSNNTLTFFIDTELGAPDLDRVGLARSTVDGSSADACDPKTWRATASVMGGAGGGPAAAIDGDLATVWANNRAQDGTDWFEVDFGGLVKLAQITLDDSKSFPNDYAGSYAVFGSLDGVSFDALPFVTGNGAPNKTVINFVQRTVRAVKITEVGSARASSWWQIGELETVCYQ